MTRGWLAGLEEGALVLERLVSSPVRWGRALGLRWPYAITSGCVVGPGLPVAACPEPEEGPDGVYTLRNEAVFREAVGTEGPFLGLDGVAHRSGSASPDLLWFGLTERFVLRGGELEIEDLFSRVTSPVDASALEEMLVRRGRFPEALVSGLPVGRSPAQPAVEVRRVLDLVPASWQDPAVLLSRREGVASGHREGATVALDLEDGGHVELVVDETGTGWSAELRTGTLPWRTITAEASDGVLRYRAVPAPGLNPLDPGVRTRIAFDLLSDLVLLGS